MKKRLLAILLVAALVVVLAAGCNGAGSQPDRQPGDPARAMFITQAMSNASQAFSWSEFQRLMGDFNIEMSVAAGENEVAVEIEGIERAIAERYDVIFINPSNIDAVVPALTRAREAGIIIGMFSSELAQEHQHIRHFFAGSDDFEGGRLAGQFVSARFPDGANVVEVGGQAGHDAQIKRHDGFRAGIADNIIIIDSQNAPGGWNAHEARGIMEDFLITHGDAIDIVWCHWDHGASAVIEAAQAAGRDDIFIIGVDGNATGYRQVMEGTQALSVGQSFTNMAHQSLQNARILLDGGNVPEVNIIPMDMVTIENVHDLPFPDW
jgi:ribose transport system substrate-binding protein